LSWAVASAFAAVGLRRAGAALPPTITLALGGLVFAVDHVAPFGPVGMALFLVAAILLERQGALASRRVSTL
jgi:hypothetical protein